MSDIKITYGESEALSKFHAELSATKPSFTIPTWLKLSRNASALHELNKHAEGVRLNLVDKYGEKVDGVKSVPAKNMAAFTKDYNEMQGTKADVKLEKVSAKDLGDSLTGGDGVYLFMIYIVDDSEEVVTTEVEEKAKENA